MKMSHLFLAALLLFFSPYSSSYSEEDFASRDGDLRYLDYVKAREQEYEYALRLRDAMRRNEGRYTQENDEFDEEHEGRFYDGERDQPHDDEDEDEKDAEDVEKNGNSRQVDRWKEEINGEDSPNRLLHNGKSLHSHKPKKAPGHIKEKKDQVDGKRKKEPKKSGKKDSSSSKTRIENRKVKGTQDENDHDMSPRKSEDDNLENEGIKKNIELPKKSSKKEDSSKKKDERKILSNDESSKKTVTMPVTTTSVSPKEPMPKAKPVSSKKESKKLGKALFVVVVAACSVAGVAGLILAAYCWYRLRADQEAMPEEDPKKYVKKKKKPRKSELSNDEKLAKSAEVYHYMHTKKQLAAMDKNDSERKRSTVEDSDSSDEESDNTVYECPGLAPPGDMKVVNPLFSDAERDHSDARSDGSHVSSPINDKSPPQKETEKKE